MTTILAVHGTFATDADWTKPGSPLRSVFETALREDDKPAHFEPIVWSGQNRINHRLIGAKLIRDRVISIKAAKPSERIILVGHSHGGSAAAYFLEQFDKEERFIYGAVFLSTPFIAFRPKDDLGHRVKTYSYLGLFAIQIGFLFVTKYIAEQHGVTSQAIYLLLMFNLLFGLFLLHTYRTFGFFDKMVEGRRAVVAEAVRTQDSCRLPNRRYLFVRFSGDEASMGLSFAQSVTFALNWMMELVYEHALRLTHRAKRHRMVGKDVLELAALVLISAWLMSCPLMVGYTLSFDEVQKLVEADKRKAMDKISADIDAGNEKLKRLDKDLLDPGASIMPYRPPDVEDPYNEARNRKGGLSPAFDERVAANRAWYVSVSRGVAEDKLKLEAAKDDDHGHYRKFYLVRMLQWIAAIVVYLLFILGSASMLIYLCLRAFGSTDLTALLYLEGSVEVVPQGSHSLVHLDWKDTAIKRRNLRHSAVYSSPVALDAIAEWLEANLATEAYNSS